MEMEKGTYDASKALMDEIRDDNNYYLHKTIREGEIGEELQSSYGTNNYALIVNTSSNSSKKYAKQINKKYGIKYFKAVVRCRQIKYKLIKSDLKVNVQGTPIKNNKVIISHYLCPYSCFDYLVSYENEAKIHEKFKPKETARFIIMCLLFALLNLANLFLPISLMVNTDNKNIIGIVASIVLDLLIVFEWLYLKKYIKTHTRVKPKYGNNIGIIYIIAHIVANVICTGIAFANLIRINIRETYTPIAVIIIAICEIIMIISFSISTLVKSLKTKTEIKEIEDEIEEDSSSFLSDYNEKAEYFKTNMVSKDINLSQ